MKQLAAFTKKEFLEQLRTGRFFILMILFFLFGIMNPAVAKLMPWMMELMSEQFAQSGMLVSSVEVNALTSWIQFFKNMPIALIVFLVMFSSVLTAEYQKGTLINVITKGLKRWKILASKLAVMAAVWTMGCLLSYLITFGYNSYFWDNSIVNNICFSVFGFYLTGVWLITVVLLASALFRSASAVTLSAGAAFFAAYIVSLIPCIKKYSPVYLLESTDLLMGARNVNDYFPAVIVMLVIIVINIFIAVLCFNKKYI